MPLELAQAITESRLAELRERLAPLFKTPLPVTLEVGSGHGHFLTAYAQAHPDKFCIGIDLLPDRLARSERKSNRAGLANIAWLRADVNLFIEALPADTRLAEIFILFSDPWPKRRHWKNRVLQAEFLTKLAARAGEQARVCFRTDHAPYFGHAIETFNAHADWQIDPMAPWPFELATVFQQRSVGYQSLVAIRRSS